MIVLFFGHPKFDLNRFNSIIMTAYRFKKNTKYKIDQEKREKENYTF